MAKKEKKINCKHGLDKKQEIQSRRLRIKLEQEDKEVIQEYKNIYNKWLASPKESFEQYLEKNEPVYYSALQRVCKSQGIKEVYLKFVKK